MKTTKMRAPPLHRVLVFGVVCFISVMSLGSGMEADLYLNKDKFGEFFKLEISEKGCTNVPLNWENQAVSLDTHGSCIKFYDLPYCRGKFVALQPYHGTFQDNLEALRFSRIISSASPCGPKVPTGRYYIQNGADGSVLTVETKNNTPIVKAHSFKPYISKGQQFQLEKVSLADYEIIPRINQNLNPLTYDMSISTSAHPVRRVWKIESVYRGRYLIKNEWNNKCLYKSDSGRVEEHDCVTWSPNQEWIFRSIKVKPYFPTKEEIQKNPIKPDSNLAFEPQDDAFSPIPYQPNTVNGIQGPGRVPGFPLPPSGKGGKNTKAGSKHPVQIQRPGPMIINPGEPFPPVFPFPILPKASPATANSKTKEQKPPVPQIRHPGPLPYPVEPMVLDPKKPTISPLDAFNVFTNAQYQSAIAAIANRTEEKKKLLEEKAEEDDEDVSDEEEIQDDQDQDRARSDEDHEEDDHDDHSDSESEEEYHHPPVEEYYDNHSPSPNYIDPLIRFRRKKKHEKLSGVKYSDYRLWF